MKKCILHRENFSLGLLHKAQEAHTKRQYSRIAQQEAQSTGFVSLPIIVHKHSVSKFTLVRDAGATRSNLKLVFKIFRKNLKKWVLGGGTENVLGIV